MRTEQHSSVSSPSLDSASSLVARIEAKDETFMAVQWRKMKNLELVSFFFLLVITEPIPQNGHRKKVFVVGRQVAPKDTLEPVNVTFYNKMDFAVVIKLRVLRWGSHPGLGGSPKWDHRYSAKRKAEGDWQTEEKAAGWQSEIGENAYPFGYRDGWRELEPRDARKEALETGKDQERDLPLKLPQGVQPCLHLDFSPVKLLLGI